METGWLDAIERLGRQAIGVTLPGHGPGCSDNPKDYADLAALVAENLPNKQVDIVGFSLGAKLTLALASLERTRFRRIVLGGVGDNLFAPEPDGEAMARYLLGHTQSASPAIAQLAAYGLANGNEPAPLAAILRRPTNQLLAPKDLPAELDILLVNSKTDAIAMPDDRLRAAMPHLTYKHIDGCDHLGLPGDPRFRTAAMTFLA